MIWQAQDRQWDLRRRALVMGILNVTPDSFSDGGRFFSVEKAVEHGLRLVAEGADVIDVGGESTRPGAQSVGEGEECARVVTVIRALRSVCDVAISIDTSKAGVARAALEAGACIVNDVTGLRDPAMPAVVAESGAGVVIMHMQGEPRSMQAAPHYDDVVAEVRGFLRDRRAFAEASGIALGRIAVDPGIGFGKSVEHNVEIIHHLAAFVQDGSPVLLGVSRKSFIGRLLGEDSLARRDWPTVALTAMAIERGVRLLRVHDVRPNVEAARMTEAILYGV